MQSRLSLKQGEVIEGLEDDSKTGASVDGPAAHRASGSMLMDTDIS
jgi:hypothetical protein